GNTWRTPTARGIRRSCGPQTPPTSRKRRSRAIGAKSDMSSVDPWPTYSLLWAVVLSDPCPKRWQRRMAGVGHPAGMRWRPWLSVEAICPHALSMIQCRIKELAALRFQGAQLAIAHLGILDRGKKVRASTIATFRADRKLRPGALGLSDCTHKTQVARALYFVQGAQPDCAAHLGERLRVTTSERAPSGVREVCCDLKPRGELHVALREVAAHCGREVASTAA